MRLLICAAILTGNVAACAVASETAAPATPPSDAHQVITALSKDIYRLAERSGGTPEQWRTLEDRALTALKHLEGQSPETLVAQDAKGRTPLMLAASAGYLPIVRALLENASVTASIEHKNPEGADAYDLALLASRINLRACHPTSENPFQLVPFMVTQPYYEARQPYPEILTLLEEAGADPSQETARTLWLKNCSNPSTEHQQAIATSSNLPQTLADIRHDVDRQAKLQEIREGANLLREIFAPRVQSGKMSQQELDAEIAKLYAQSGFEPPTAATGESQ